MNPLEERRTGSSGAPAFDSYRMAGYGVSVDGILPVFTSFAMYV